MNRDPGRRGGNRRVRSGTRVLAMVTALALSACTPGGDSHTDAKSSSAPPVAAVPAPETTTTLGPDVAAFSPNGWTLSCSYSERTIQAGNTVFALTTAGLHDNEWFMNQVYAFNLKDIARQAETDPALRDPDNIAIGHSFKILDHCVDAGPVSIHYDDSHYDFTDPNYRAPSEYRRDISYQSYPGTDGQDHNNVVVTYLTNQAGMLLDVKSCAPAPSCYLYVEGSP